jgi:hypothetical protein
MSIIFSNVNIFGEMNTTYALIIAIIIILLFIGWRRWSRSQKMAATTVVAVPVSVAPAAATTTPATSSERFNPKYDRTFSQSITDRQMDKMKDQKGYTVDDYALGDLLYQRESNK